MKKILLLSAAMLIGFAVQAQNYIVINSETIFKSMASYNDAVETIDKMAEQYQKTIDDAYAELEKTYNDYQSQRAYLSETGRQQREDAIINREREIAEYQQQVFGQEGDLLQKRIELIKPIQDRVFEVINDYAKNNGYDMVLDLASNPSILYYSPSTDKTDAIIALLK